MTLSAAPAGFGKTTLVSECIGGSERPAVWLALDVGDNDPVQFLTYLIAALQQVDERIGQTARQVLQAPPPQSLVASLINEITAAATALTLVLDDYHLITSTAVHQILHVLLDRQPVLLHVVICTREDPPLPLPRLLKTGRSALCDPLG